MKAKTDYRQVATWGGENAASRRRHAEMSASREGGNDDDDPARVTIAKLRLIVYP